MSLFESGIFYQKEPPSPNKISWLTSSCLCMGVCVCVCVCEYVCVWLMCVSDCDVSSYSLVCGFVGVCLWVCKVR